MPTLTVGDIAPDFSLVGQDGKKYSLKDFRGKKVVLYFYPKDNTKGCTAEACGFRDNYRAIEKSGAVVLGISADGLLSHQKFSEAYRLNFPILSDETKEVIKQYGVWKKKQRFGKTYMGIVRSTFIIDEQGKISHIFSNVRVEGHVEKVLMALTSQ